MTHHRFNQKILDRRSFLFGVGATGAGLAALGAPRFLRAAPAVITRAGARPNIPFGVQSGDVTASRGIIWSATDRPARMMVTYATTDSFTNARRIRGPAALDANGFTAKIDLTGLPSGQHIFYEVRFEDLGDPQALSEPIRGHFKTAPAGGEDVSFVWSGDTAGQGWGINLDWGGMKAYETMRRNAPDFFIHSGDTIYADGPIPAEKKKPDGTLWKNLVTEEKSKVAETLKEFRGNYAYNLMDANVRRFNAEVPMFAQWDDHETLNNWYPGESLISDDRYKVKNASLLSARANRAFMEYMPLRQHASERERVYRIIHYGPSLDIFFLDMRTYRAANSANRQPEAGPETVFLGADQIHWFKRQLMASKATWKLIASDMPIGIMVRDKDDFENAANGDGPVLGREHEIADLLRFISHNGVRNVVWVTTDVHYTAAHYYDPNQAQFTDFHPFWEFVSGPIHAGSYGPGDMDNTFGPRVVYQKSPEGRKNLPPSDGLQFFGHVKIDGKTGVMSVSLKDLNDATLYAVDLTPER